MCTTTVGTTRSSSQIEAKFSQYAHIGAESMIGSFSGPSAIFKRALPMQQDRRERDRRSMGCDGHLLSCGWSEGVLSRLKQRPTRLH